MSSKNGKPQNYQLPYRLGDVRSITKAFSQMLVLLISNEAEKVKKLLLLHGVPLSKKPSEKEMIRGIVGMVGMQDPAFNHDLSLLIEMTLPELSGNEQYDNFGQSPFQFGGSTRLYGGSGGATTFGGSAGIGGSGGTSAIDGAKSIGGSTASGAAGGGIVGGILGAVGGFFNHRASVNQQKIQEEEASNKVFSELLRFKRGGSNGGNRTGTYVLVGVSMLALIGIILFVAKKQGNKEVAV